MKKQFTRLEVPKLIRNYVVIICALLILPGDTLIWAMQTPQNQAPAKPSQAAASAPAANSGDAQLPPEQLDSLVAPIALYPDPLLAQTLAASTYPLEIVQLQQFLQQNKSLKDKALTDAVMKQDWDPSVQAMAGFPDVVKQMADNVRWTNDLGNAFLAQQKDVMDAVQRLRAKAAEKGALKSSDKMTVETRVVESKTVYVVQPASTEVVYVPSYNPTVVWGAPVYPYPVYSYPAYPAGGMLLSFGAGMAVGAAAWGGGWGWNTGWGGNNDIYVNRNNAYVNHYNNNRANNGNRYGANGNWNHNPQHRGGAPYANRATAERYNGAARGDNLGQRQNAARQSQRTAQQSGGLGNRAGGSTFSNNGANRGAGLSNSGQGVNRGAAGGGGDRIGNRQVSNSSMGSRNSSAFSGSGSGRSAAKASSSRGSSSFSGSRGGGVSRGGGGRGGGGRRR